MKKKRRTDHLAVHKSTFFFLIYFEGVLHFTFAYHIHLRYPEPIFHPDPEYYGDMIE